MQPRLHASCIWAIATPTTPIADSLALQPYCPEWKLPLEHYSGDIFDHLPKAAEQRDDPVGFGE